MTTQDQLIIDIIVKNREAIKNIEDVRKSINKTANGVRVGQKEVSAAFNQMAASSKQASMDMQKNIMMAGFSFLFTGMALKRMFDTIRNDAFNVFNKLTANTQMANNAMSRLNMTTDYLKFTLADAMNSAIEPMLPMLMNVVEWLVNWIENNSELAGKILIWGGILAGVTMILGQMGLAYLGIVGAGKLLGGMGLANLFWNTGMAAAASTDALWSFSNILGSIVKLGIGLALTWAGFKILDSALDNESILGMITSSVIALIGGALAGKAIAKFVPALGVGANIGAVIVAVGLGIKFGGYFTEKADNAPTFGKKMLNGIGEFLAIVASSAGIGFVLGGGPWGAVAGGMVGLVIASANLILRILGFDVEKKKAISKSDLYSGMASDDVTVPVTVKQQIDNIFTISRGLSEDVNVFTEQSKKIATNISNTANELDRNMTSSNNVIISTQGLIADEVLNQKEIVTNVDANLSPLASEDFATKIQTIDTNFEGVGVAAGELTSTLNNVINNTRRLQSNLFAMSVNTSTR